jgi:molybdate transport system substrate-binding protein
VKRSLALFLALFLAGPARAEKVTIAAAADLRFAMEELVASFKQGNPKDEVEVIYGSSGKSHTQIHQGASFDLFFSADISLPEELAKAGWRPTR